MNSSQRRCWALGEADGAHTPCLMLPAGTRHQWDLVIISSPFQTVTLTDFCTGAGVRRLNSDHMEPNAGGFRIKIPIEFGSLSAKYPGEHSGFYGLLIHRQLRCYLSENCPEMKEPMRTPTKNRDVVSGAFQSSSHTRFHCKRRGCAQTQP